MWDSQRPDEKHGRERPFPRRGPSQFPQNRERDTKDRDDIESGDDAAKPPRSIPPDQRWSRPGVDFGDWCSDLHGRRHLQRYSCLTLQQGNSGSCGIGSIRMLTFIIGKCHMVEIRTAYVYSSALTNPAVSPCRVDRHQVYFLGFPAS